MSYELQLNLTTGELELVNLGGSSSDVYVKVDSADTTTNYLDSKITTSSEISKTILNVGGNEQIELSLYHAITITAFTNDVNQAEKGSTVNSATFGWALSKVETDQTISPPLEYPGVGVRSKLYTGLGLTDDQTWTLWCTDGTTSATAYSGIYFRSKRYWEANTNAGPLNDSDINGMAGQELATGYASTKSFNCSGGKYIWFCYPASWGTATFWVGGLQVIFNLTVQAHTNASGYTCNYNCYRSTYLQNGNPIVVVIV